MRENQEATSPHICFVSYHPEPVFTNIEHELIAWRDCALALVDQGYQVHWITSTDNMRMNAWETVGTALAENLPATCRYVVPCQCYRIAGVSLLCVDARMWQDTALHTRLFTFLRLLHRELNWGVVHAWGSVVSVYVAVYTARFLRLPVLVSYRDTMLEDRHRQSFVWQWVKQHTAAFIVRTEAERQHLLRAGDLAAQDIRVVHPGQADAVTAQADMVTHLLA